MSNAAKQLFNRLSIVGWLNQYARALVISVVLSLSNTVVAQYNNSTERLAEIPDPGEPMNNAEIDALEAKALAGDWGLKQQFAASYLYEYRKLEYWDWGCRHLQYGHVCRAMAKRIGSGQRFLQEIIDLDRNGPIDKNTLARFQFDYARRQMFDARPEFLPQHPACKEAIRYLERAIENEATPSGQSCVALRVREMYWHGQCVEKNVDKSDEYTKLTIGCPRF